MFEEDLKFGKEMEKEFASRLFKYDVVSIEIMEGEFKDYDVKAKFRRNGELVCKTYEVKTDTISNRTGKVGFEYECNGTPSGVMASKADYIVYRLGEDYYYADRGRLLTLLATAEKEYYEGGDRGAVRLWVIPKEVFYTVAHKI